MARTWGPKSRATIGFSTAVLVGVIGASVSAAVLVGTDPNTAGHNDLRVHPGAVLPSPVPLPDTVLMAPRADVLTYTAMSESWVKRSGRAQRVFCRTWRADGPAARTDTVSAVMRNATALSKPWMLPATVAQFFDEACS